MPKRSIIDPENHRWRTGRKVGRTIYAIQHPEDKTDRDEDPLIGVMDTPELAEEAVRTHNLDHDIRASR
jgi:hypothetical protein